jgi:hypothetical protein
MLVRATTQKAHGTQVVPWLPDLLRTVQGFALPLLY